MNQRIKQLTEQAEKYADDNFKGEPTYSEAYDSKFAELIVRECALIAFHNVVNLSSIADAEDVEANIREYFGVEE
jgi:hypothetical protein